MPECRDPNRIYVDGSTVECGDSNYECLTWSGNDCVLWNDNPFTWSIQEIIYECLTWSGNDCVLWNDNPFTWSDCLLIQEIIAPIIPGSPGDPNQHIRKKDEPDWFKKSCEELDGKCLEKRKRLIKLVCYVRDKKVVQEKDMRDMKMCISDVVLVKKAIEKKLNIKLNNDIYKI